jgi:hypothetical protein
VLAGVVSGGTMAAIIGLLVAAGAAALRKRLSGRTF